MNPVAAEALTIRLRRAGASDPVFVDDCNDAIDEVVAAVPSTALTLAFVDPTNWQVRFETIARLVQARKTDLLVTFMYGMMKRVATYDPPALTAFFGTPRWKECLGCARWEVLDALASLYHAQLEPFGYLPNYTRRIVVPNTKNVPMYALVLFSRSERGVDFWKKAIGGPTASDQHRLPGF
jgi:three-Cys-motif partner protein